MVKDGFSKNNLAKGESWNRNTLFNASSALRSNNGRQDETNACNYGAHWIARRTVRRESKHGCTLKVLDVEAKLSGKSVIAEMKKDGAFQWKATALD